MHTTVFIRRLYMLLTTLIVGASALPAQTLDDYICEGLAKNLAYRQQRLALAQSDESVSEARGGFLPSITLNARATELYGNVINLGNLINPAYATLNQLTGSNVFPTNLDIRLPLQRETKLELRQPLIQPKVLFNYQIKAHLRDATEAETEAKARELVAQIKVAYLNYAKTLKVVELYAETVSLLEENVRVNQSLVKNEKATLDALYRAEAELADVKQGQADALRLNEASRQFFNFLLDRPLASPIALVSDTAFASLSLDALQRSATKREELKQIQSGIAATEKVVSLSTADFFPTLSLGVDYGFQGNRYDFSSDQDFATVSLVAQWNIFNGFQDKAKREQAKIETNRLNTRYKELESQIALQVRTTYDDATVAQQNIAVAEARLRAAEASFNLVSKKYAQGQVSQVEFLDSRTAFTNASINAVITRYDAYIKQAELERAAATLNLSQFTTKLNGEKQ
ncbi:MAG: TolC family protein [Chloroherpetonaceae bacterium]